MEKIKKAAQNKSVTSYHASASSWDNTYFVLYLIKKPPKSVLKMSCPFILEIASLQLTGEGVFE